jgi:hypothetical protein
VAAAGNGLSRLLAQLVEDLGAVAAGQADLARRVLRADLAAAHRSLALHLGGVLLLSTGLVLLFAGVSLWLGQILGNPVWGMLLVGGMLALLGGALAAGARRRLFRRGYLAQSRQELLASWRWLREDVLPRFYRDRA